MRILFLTLVLAFAAQSASAQCSWPGFYSTPEEKCEREQLLKGIVPIKPIEDCIAETIPWEDLKAAWVRGYEAACATKCDRSREIYDNCISAKMPDGKIDRDKRRAIKGACGRIACNPSILDKLRY